MSRLTVATMKQTRLNQVIGVCQENTPAICSALNAAQTRLLYAKEAGDEGWFSTWAHVVFNVNPTNPYVTLPREIARIERANVCRKPVNVQNQFYEFLEFGNGYQPHFSCFGNVQSCQPRQIFDRGMVVTFRDFTPGHLIRVRASDPLDMGGTKRVLISGTDLYDKTVYSLDGVTNVAGVFVTLVNPFADTPLPFNLLTGIQKDVTYGQVEFSDVDPVTGAETVILVMEPSEQTAHYRRYYLHGLPPNCCPIVTDSVGNKLVQVDAIVKLNAIPVELDSDYLLLQNVEALIAECQSMRYSTMDIPGAKGMAIAEHKNAIGLLQGELAHYLGTDNPAITFKPFGSAALENQRIGTML